MLVLYFSGTHNLEVEGCPVQAVVDTGADDHLERPAAPNQPDEQEAGRGMAAYLSDSKCQGVWSCGSGRSQLTITAEAQLQFTLDDHEVTIPVFVAIPRE